MSSTLDPVLDRLKKQPQPAKSYLEPVAKLHEKYQQIRARSLAISHPLSDADMCIQSMTDASPIRWHLAHTSWFFETFILKPHVADYRIFNPEFNYLFNSYYNGVGKQFPRHLRGTQTRPDINIIKQYRRHVDEAMNWLLQHSLSFTTNAKLLFLTELGLHHEQQHQELMLTDIKHAFSLNPLFPAYLPATEAATSQHQRSQNSIQWLSIPKGIYHLGHAGEGFCFDNEKPCHPQYLQSFYLASKPVSNREYMAFIDDGGYSKPEFWLADGWTWLQQEAQQAPLYWRKQQQSWYEFSLRGLRSLNPDEPVSHINAYEANAYASWCGKRLPTEFEWEAACQLYGDVQEANFYNAAILHPVAFGKTRDHQFFGNLWEWTSSPYTAYPGFKPFAGQAGEYNGKFMCNQWVLRGGSCVSPEQHVRISYRNFFYPQQRWQFTGIRLAADEA